MKPETEADLVRAQLLTLIERIAIRTQYDKNLNVSEYNRKYMPEKLTPYQQTIRELCAKYKVPSPYDET